MNKVAKLTHLQTYLLKLSIPLSNHPKLSEAAAPF